MLENSRHNHNNYIKVTLNVRNVKTIIRDTVAGEAIGVGC